MAERPDGSIDIIIVPGPNENYPPPVISEERRECLSQRQKPVRILFTGLPGAGKSTLVNTMLGKNAAQAVPGPDPVVASKAQYEEEFEGVKLQVYDTNGYSESNHKIPKSGSFDLILICIKITNRVSDGEIKLLKALAKAFDKEAWNRTVIVLTFANILIQDPNIKYDSEERQREVMNKLIDTYKESITKHLESHTDKETAHSIPFCLAGESNPHDLSDRSVRKLPTTEDWLVDLWETCANRINPEIKSWYERLIDFIRKILKLS